MPFNPKTYLQTAPQQPGVYRMYDHSDTIIYVGKAKNLKKRLSSYFGNSSSLTGKTLVLVKQIARIDVTVTHTESEALILENTQIKHYQPRYNVLLKDDKSYPFIIMTDHAYPRLGYHRGTRRGKHKYFGPFPHAKAVYESLHLMQRLFPIRQCEDTVFRSRSRPCLQYQIKRCSAPCVGYISSETYAEEVNNAVLFLEGKSQAVIERLVEKMQAAAQALEYEQAAQFRDQINSLKAVQERQYVNTAGGNIDVIVSMIDNNVHCVQILSIRDGRHLGSRGYFPKNSQHSTEAELLAAFIAQYYLDSGREVPNEVVVNHSFDDMDVLAEAIGEQRKTKVQIRANVRSTRARWIQMAEENAKVSITQHKPSQYRDQLAALATALNLEELPQRMECFDISHSQGEATVASCVVFNTEGPATSAYRRYNIKDIQAGDDYAAMQQALTRRYSDSDSDNLPDILFIDGGKGQIGIAQTVLAELNLTSIRLVGVAKGAGRKAGLEKLVLPEQNEPLLLPPNAPALHLVQRIRDEAHRFAITSHRQKRDKARRISSLEQIEGIGAKRRQKLLMHFGGLQGVSRAGVEELARVPGVSRQLAQKIYDFFQNA